MEQKSEKEGYYWITTRMNPQGIIGCYWKDTGKFTICGSLMDYKYLDMEIVEYLGQNFADFERLFKTIAS